MNGRTLYLSMEKHLTEDDRPSLFFNDLENEVLSSELPFTMLGRLKQTPQSPVYHPEGSVWNHTMLVVDEAAKRKAQSSDQKVFMWAALLHDIGKPDTTCRRNGKITSYNHEKLGASMSKEFLGHFEADAGLIEKVSALIRWHMQILFVVKSPRFAEMESMKRQAPIGDIALLGLCDRLGRFGTNRQEEEKNIGMFLKRCGE